MRPFMPQETYFSSELMPTVLIFTIVLELRCKRMGYICFLCFHYYKKFKLIKYKLIIYKLNVYKLNAE